MGRILIKIAGFSGERSRVVDARKERKRKIYLLIQAF